MGEGCAEAFARAEHAGYALDAFALKFMLSAIDNFGALGQYSAGLRRHDTKLIVR